MNLIKHQKLLLAAENRLAHAKKVVSDKLGANFTKKCEGKTIKTYTIRDHRVFIQFQDGTYWQAQVQTDGEGAFLSTRILDECDAEARLYVTEEELAEVRASRENIIKTRTLLNSFNSLKDLAEFLGKEALKELINES